MMQKDTENKDKDINKAEPPSPTPVTNELIDELEDMRMAKHQIKAQLEAIFGEIPEGVKFEDYIPYLNSLPRLANTVEHVVFFSWLDINSGQPCSNKVTVKAGDTLSLPEHFNTGQSTYVKSTSNTPSLTSNTVSGDVDKLTTGIHEDLIIQKEYTVDKVSYEDGHGGKIFHPITFCFRSEKGLLAPVIRFAFVPLPPPKHDVSVNNKTNVIMRFDGEQVSFPGGFYTLETEYGMMIELKLRLEEYLVGKPGNHKVEIYTQNNWASIDLGEDLYKWIHLGPIDPAPNKQGIGQLFSGEWETHDERFYCHQLTGIFLPPTTGHEEGWNVRVGYSATDYLESLTTFVYEGTLRIMQENFNNNKALRYISTSKKSDKFLGNMFGGTAFRNSGMQFLSLENMQQVFTTNSFSGANDLEVLKGIKLSSNEAHSEGLFNECTSLRYVPPIPKYKGGAIGENFMRNCKSIPFFPDWDDLGEVTVEKISRGFLSGCSGAAGSFTLPYTVQEIGDDFMSGCTQLTGFDARHYYLDGIPPFSSTLPINLVKIGNNFLRECINFKTGIYLADCAGLTTIGDYFCAYATKLEDIGAFADKIYSIGSHFLEGCDSIIELRSLPTSIKTIGDHFLYGCSKLKYVHMTSIFLGEEHTEFDGDKSTCFAECPSLEAIYVPEVELDNYRHEFPHLNPSLFVPEGTMTHLVAFRWVVPRSTELKENLLYENGNYNTYAIKTQVKTVYHGRPCSYPDSWSTRDIPAGDGNPKLTYSYTSGDTAALSSVERNLVIQAEYYSEIEQDPAFAWSLERKQRPNAFVISSGRARHYSVSKDIPYVGPLIKDFLSDEAVWLLENLYIDDLCACLPTYQIDNQTNIGEISDITVIENFFGVDVTTEQSKASREILSLLFGPKSFARCSYNFQHGFSGLMMNNGTAYKILGNTIRTSDMYRIVLSRLSMLFGPIIFTLDFSDRLANGAFFKLGGSVHDNKYFPDKVSWLNFLRRAPGDTSKMAVNQTQTAVESMFLGTSCGALLSNAINQFWSLRAIFINRFTVAESDPNRGAFSIDCANLAGSSRLEYIPALKFKDGTYFTNVQGVGADSPDPGTIAMTRYVPAVENVDSLEHFCGNSDAVAVAPMRNIKRIGAHFFDGAWRLEEMLALDNTGLQSVGGKFMNDCTNLRVVRLPPTVRSIGNYFLTNYAKRFFTSPDVYNSLPHLRDVYLEGIKADAFQGEAFVGCPRLENIYLSSEEDVEEYAARFPHLDKNIFKVRR